MKKHLSFILGPAILALLILFSVAVRLFAWPVAWLDCRTTNAWNPAHSPFLPHADCLDTGHPQKKSLSTLGVFLTALFGVLAVIGTTLILVLPE